MRAVSWRDVGVLPLLVVLPFTFYPKVLSGDTQPWVLMAALIAFFTFRPDRLLKRRDVTLIAVALSCVLVYALRSESQYLIVRNTYTYLAFIVFWAVCRRENGEYFPVAVKVTVVTWFVVGLMQYLMVATGFELAIGRYNPGRSGVPSLTAEASYYGSLSMVHLMYLLSENGRRNRPFIACAAASVVLSGSVLAMTLFVFPLLRLPFRLRVASLISLPALILADYSLRSAGLIARLSDMTTEGISVSSFLLDYSFNLRVGHMYFTLVHNLIPSLMLKGPVSFMEQYNSFALSTGVLWETGSDFILPALGEMIYGTGILGVILLVMVIRRVRANHVSTRAKLEKVGFILACMMNPITISSFFLIMYAHTRD